LNRRVIAVVPGINISKTIPKTRTGGTRLTGKLNRGIGCI
jgi:hypothetical protein